MNVACLYHLHVLEETTAAEFTTGERLCLPQFDRIIVAKTVP